MFIESGWLCPGQVEWKADEQVAQLVECTDEKDSQNVVQVPRRAGITAAQKTYKNPQEYMYSSIVEPLFSYTAIDLLRMLFFYLSCN